MRINHNGVYQGWYMPTVKQFNVYPINIDFDKISIPEEVIETLRLSGCDFILADVLRARGGSELVTVSFSTFMAQAVKHGADLVYHVR